MAVVNLISQAHIVYAIVRQQSTITIHLLDHVGITTRQSIKKQGRTNAIPHGQTLGFYSWEWVGKGEHDTLSCGSSKNTRLHRGASIPTLYAIAWRVLLVHLPLWELCYSEPEKPAGILDFSG
jgi:hypothetical protein